VHIHYSFPLVRLYCLGSYLLLNTLAAQSLLIRINNLPPAGDRIQVLCRLDSVLVYRVQYDYKRGTTFITKEIQLPGANGYSLIAAATNGAGKLPLIVATGRIDNVNIAPGSREATLTLSTPRAQLLQVPTVQGGNTLLFRYMETGALLEPGDPVTLWCTETQLKINTTGRTIVEPVKVDSDGGLYAAFSVPNSDQAKYCQAGYYSTHFTLANQIPIFVYPDLTNGDAPFNVMSIPTLAQGPSRITDVPTSAPGPIRSNGRTRIVVRTGKNGRLERVVEEIHE
jgi:hypothetical protein